MGQFDALAVGSEEHGVIADDVSATEGMHANFTRLARADVAEATMGDVILIGGAGFLVENFKQAASGAGWGIDFVLVVHFGDLDVEAVLGEYPGRLAGEPEECVYADGVVCGIDDADGFGGFMDEGALGIGMAGGADDEVGAVLERGFYQGGGEGMDGEVDGAGGFGDCEIEVLARIMGGDYGNLSLSGGINDGLAHAA